MIKATFVMLAIAAGSSSAMANTPNLRVMPMQMTVRAQTAAQDQPPAELTRNMAVEHDGWIYQEIRTGREYQTTIYRGDGYPATIMVCSTTWPVTLISREFEEIRSQNGMCTAVTTDFLRLSTFGPSADFTSRVLPVRYKILAVHTAGG